MAGVQQILAEAGTIVDTSNRRAGKIRDGHHREHVAIEVVVSDLKERFRR